jgi:hypothetical protein
MICLTTIPCKKVGFFRNNIKNIIRWILIELPNTTVIWSQILPRLKWRYSTNQTAMHECRYRIYSIAPCRIFKNMSFPTGVRWTPSDFRNILFRHISGYLILIGVGSQVTSEYPISWRLTAQPRVCLPCQFGDRYVIFI